MLDPHSKFKAGTVDLVNFIVDTSDVDPDPDPEV